MIDRKIFDITRNFHGVKGLIYIGNKILVCRRDDKTTSFPLHIDLPGGGREDSESPFQTFRREVDEEFGIKIDEKDVRYSKQYMSPIDPSKESYFIVAKPPHVSKDDIVFGNEGLDFMLIEMEEYLKLRDVIERQRDRVRDFLSTIE